MEHARKKEKARVAGEEVGGDTEVSGSWDREGRRWTGKPGRPGERKGDGKALEARTQKTLKEKIETKHAAEDTTIVRREGLRGRCGELELGEGGAGRGEGGTWRTR
jgi:hypothetical protein